MPPEGPPAAPDHQEDDRLRWAVVIRRRQNLASMLLVALFVGAVGHYALTGGPEVGSAGFLAAIGTLLLAAYLPAVCPRCRAFLPRASRESLWFIFPFGSRRSWRPPRRCPACHALLHME